MSRVIEVYDLPDTIDIGTPVLLLTGSDGPSYLRDGIRAVDTSIPDSQLVEFEGLGHNGPVSDPERVSTAGQDPPRVRTIG